MKLINLIQLFEFTVYKLSNEVELIKFNQVILTSYILPEDWFVVVFAQTDKNLSS